MQSQLNLIQAYMISGKHAAAVEEANLLYPAWSKRLGEDHEMALQLLMTRAQSEGMLERFDDAVRDDLRANSLATKKLGSHSFLAIASLIDAATAQCRDGQATSGLNNARAALANSSAAFGKTALTYAAQFTLAECEIGLSRYADAMGHLGSIDAAAVAQLAGDPNWGANVELEKARIAMATNRSAEARPLLEAVRAVYVVPGVDPYQARLWHELTTKLR